MATFQQTWKIGRYVQQISKPRRRGRIQAVRGSGPGATIIVALIGWHMTAFSPSQLTLL